MYSRKDLHDRYLAKLESYVVNCKESQRYSSDRFDVLIISLSTTALVLSIGFIKNIFPDLVEIPTGNLKTSWLLYVLSISFNLISQTTSYYGSHYDIKCVKSEIEFELGKEHHQKHKKFDKLSRRFGNCTVILNQLSLLLFVVATGFIIFFLSNNF